MAGNDPVTLVASGAQTASGNSPKRELVDEGQFLHLGLAVSAVAGTTPSMTVSVEWSHDDGATWMPAETADAFTAVTAAGNKVKTFTVRGKWFRIVWAITGTTPSFTFAVTGYVTGS